MSNSEASFKFLEKFHPRGPWVLTAILNGKAGIETRTFHPENKEELNSWLDKHNGKDNIYFQVNPVMRDLSKKARREDIRCLSWLQVDIDPEPNQSLEKERERILELLTDSLPKGVPEPTVIIFSGGGYQAFWKLNNPIEINGDVELAEDAKRYNKQLEKLFGADSCHNVDRIMRLPGTYNIPDTKKIKRGREVELARVLNFELDRTYSLSDFKKYEDKALRQKTTIGQKHIAGSYKFSPSEHVEKIINIEDVLAPYNLPDDIVRICKCGFDPENLKREGDNSRSGWLHSAVCRMVKYGVPDEVIFSIITDSQFRISDSVLDKGSGAQKYAIRQIETAHDFCAKNVQIVLYDASPYLSAREYLWRYRPDLMHNNGDFLDYNGASYDEIEEATINSELYGFLNGQLTIRSKEAFPFNPTKSKVKNVVDALKARVHRPKDTYSPPCWLNDNDINATEVLSCRNGLLHLPTKTLYAPTPYFFTRNALDFDYDITAEKPLKWQNFLNEIWPDDEEAVDVFQEMFGYLLIPDTSLQKIFLMIGPKRSGKGTAGRILASLLGVRNVCSPTPKSLGENFGLQPLLGKSLAIMSDMRISGRTDDAVVTENLLRISGEDRVTVPRKYKPDWDGQLPTRFLLMSNELPRFRDTSGALASRFVPLIMTESFYGKENTDLTEELMTELPGILNWAIEGWQRLKVRGHFILPKSSQDVLHELSDLSSPISTFVNDECVLRVGALTPKAELYTAYKSWNEAQGNFYLPSLSVFGRDLMSVLQGRIQQSKPVIGGDRIPCYAGITLKTADQNDCGEVPF